MDQQTMKPKTFPLKEKTDNEYLIDISIVWNHKYELETPQIDVCSPLHPTISLNLQRSKGFVPPWNHHVRRKICYKNLPQMS